MTDIRREETPVSQLAIGMYVCELDRPWLGTSFMLEGILIESEEDIANIAAICQAVYIDRTMSVGHHFVAPPKRDNAIKRDDAVVNINMRQDFQTQSSQTAKKPNQAQPSSQKVSFFDIIKEIKQSNANGKSSNRPSFTKTFIHNTANAKLRATLTTNINDHDSNNPALDEHLSRDLKSLVKNFSFGFLKKKNKLNTSIDKTVLQGEIDAQPSTASDDRIYVYQQHADVEEEIAKVYDAYEQSQIATKELFESMAHDREIDLSNLNESLDSMVESVERNPDALMWLAKLKQTDDYAYNHAMNVSIMLMALGNFMALPKKQIKDLGLSGLLQDIGKAKMPKELLHKQGQLTVDEYQILKTHVDHALALLEMTENISGTVILTVSQHHERLDGSGYPYQLKEKQISLTGQMAGLIDTYCALTSNRAYAKGMYNQIALEEIHALRDIKFQGVLIDQLVQFLGIYPVSSLVELNSGEVGVVIQQNSVRRMLPRVMILLNPDKTKNNHPATIDLITLPPTPAGEPYKIVRGLPPESYGLDFASFFN